MARNRILAIIEVDRNPQEEMHVHTKERGYEDITIDVSATRVLEDLFDAIEMLPFNARVVSADWTR